MKIGLVFISGGGRVIQLMTTYKHLLKLLKMQCQKLIFQVFISFIALCIFEQEVKAILKPYLL